ncbi:endonuclease domain-containing protein [Agromyces bauzanensis]
MTSPMTRPSYELRRATRTARERRRLTEWLDARDGIAHSHDAIEAGFTRHAIQGAIASGAISRIRRSWLATTSAPPKLRHAASVGGRLACVSAAEHHGLWTVADHRLHLCVRPNASRFDAGDALVHWSAGPVAPHRYELVEPIVNALVHMADCRPLEQSLATWESAVRRGDTPLLALGRLPLRSPVARLLAEVCGELSDSGIETLPVHRLARIGIRVRQQVRIDGHRVDGLIGDRLVYQVDGYSFHSTPEQRRKDLEQDRRLVLLGYTVFRYDYVQIMFEWPTVEAELRAAIASGMHLRR